MSITPTLSKAARKALWQLKSGTPPERIDALDTLPKNEWWTIQEELTAWKDSRDAPRIESAPAPPRENGLSDRGRAVAAEMDRLANLNPGDPTIDRMPPYVQLAVRSLPPRERNLLHSMWAARAGHSIVPTDYRPSEPRTGDWPPPPTSYKCPGCKTWHTEAFRVCAQCGYDEQREDTWRGDGDLHMLARGYLIWRSFEREPWPEARPAILRYGRWLQTEQSRRYKLARKIKEAGVSCFFGEVLPTGEARVLPRSWPEHVTAESLWNDRKNRRLFEVEGTLLEDVGGDGEPLLRDVRLVRQVVDRSCFSAASLRGGEQVWTVDACVLCQAQKITPWFHEDDVCWIAACELCALPMVVWRSHGTHPPDKAIAHMVAQLGKVGAREVGAFFIDDRRRSIPDHWHAHARPSQR